MELLRSSDLLDLSDRGRNLGWISRGLLLLRSCAPELSDGQRAQVPIGVRDRLLMAMRVRTFGPEVEFVSTCSACDAQSEATVDLRTILAEHLEPPPDFVTIRVDAERVSVRSPSSSDLLAVLGSNTGRDVDLIERCVSPLPATGITDQLRAEAAAALAGSDPLADLHFQIACYRCGEISTQPFDILTVLWSEIEAAASIVVRDVHDLASAYGWPEEAILAMGSSRRRRYLALVR